MNKLKPAEMCHDLETINEHGGPYPCKNIRECSHKKHGYTWSSCICGKKCTIELKEKIRSMSIAVAN